ncbi:hypothetical protein F5Y03DRAFT_352417 [Xylaria venustula]|nr:hypothetical protein F5Y03DRAFT_352417 [Xylaria venustula]
MATFGNPPLKSECDAPQKQIQPQPEADVYDLDDIYLVQKVLSQPPRPAGTVTCRFLAIPVNEPGSFAINLAQYGHIILESRDKLIMRVPAENADLMNYIRQAWVSKYLAPFTECRITFDLPKRDRTTTVIIQRVLPKVPQYTDNFVTSDATEDMGASEASGVENGAAVRFPADGQDATPRVFKRVRDYSWYFNYESARFGY